MVLILLVVMGVGAVLILFLAKEMFTANAARLAVAKILMTHVQMVSLLATFAFIWPSGAALGLGLLSNAGSISLDSLLTAFSCIAPLDFYPRFFLVLNSPLVFLVVLIPLLLVFQKLLPGHFGSIRIRAVIAVTVISCQPFVTFRALSIFQCTDYGGVSYLSSDVVVACLGSLYEFAEAVSVLTLIAYAVVLPFILGWMGRRFVSTMTSAAASASLTFGGVCFGVISSGFSPQYWYWELVLFFRKSLFAFLAVFSTQSSAADGNSISLAAVVFVAAAELSAFFFAHALYCPFPNLTLNAFESVGQFLILLSLVGAYLLTVNTAYPAFTVPVAWALIVVNLLFFGILVSAIFRPAWTALRRRLSSMRFSVSNYRDSGVVLDADEQELMPVDK